MKTAAAYAWCPDERRQGELRRLYFPCCKGRFWQTRIDVASVCAFELAISVPRRTRARTRKHTHTRVVLRALCTGRSHVPRRRSRSMACRRSFGGVPLVRAAAAAAAHPGRRACARTAAAAVGCRTPTPGLACPATSRTLLRTPAAVAVAVRSPAATGAPAAATPFWRPSACLGQPHLCLCRAECVTQAPAEGCDGTCADTCWLPSSRHKASWRASSHLLHM